MNGSADNVIFGPNYRAFQRNRTKTPVHIRISGDSTFFQAILDNYGKGGFGLKAPVRITSETLIELEKSIAELPDLEAADHFEAKVLWCRQLDEIQQKNSFIVGGKWLVWRCDWCNEKMRFHQLYRTEESMFLCPECHNEITLLSTKGARRLKDTIDRYLLGNVL